MTSTGYVYAGGSFSGSVSLIGNANSGNPIVFSQPDLGGAADGFLLQTDANAGLVWATQITGTGPETVRAIAVDPAGLYVFVAGSFTGTMSIATMSVNSGPNYNQNCAICLQTYVAKARDPAGFRCKPRRLMLFHTPP